MQQRRATAIATGAFAITRTASEMSGDGKVEVHRPGNRRWNRDRRPQLRKGDGGEVVHHHLFR